VRLRYTLPALADLDAILDPIAAHSPQSKRRVQARIKASIELLLMHPLIGRRTGDPVIRRMTVPSYPYPIFYDFTENEVVSRDPAWRTQPVYHARGDGSA
jgi:plasmid stabilization system protein ParE